MGSSAAEDIAKLFQISASCGQMRRIILQSCPASRVVSQSLLQGKFILFADTIIQRARQIVGMRIALGAIVRGRTTSGIWKKS